MFLTGCEPEFEWGEVSSFGTLSETGAGVEDVPLTKLSAGKKERGKDGSKE